MSLDIERVLRDGYARTTASNGIILAGALFVLSAVNAVVAAGAGPRFPGMRFGLFGRPAGGMVGPVLPLPFAGLLSLIASLGTVVVAIAALRTFVTDETEELPEAHFTRRIGWAGLNVIVGAIGFGILVGIGFVFLVIPGVFLLVSLIFWEVYVAVEDENFIEAFQHSWELVRGHRWNLFGLGFMTLIISLLVNALFGIPGAIVGGFGGVLFAQAGSALTTIFGTAVLARAYCQLTADDTPDTDSDDPTPDEQDGSTDSARSDDNGDPSEG